MDEEDKVVRPDFANKPKRKKPAPNPELAKYIGVAITVLLLMLAYGAYRYF